MTFTVVSTLIICMFLVVILRALGIKFEYFLLLAIFAIGWCVTNPFKVLFFPFWVLWAMVSWPFRGLRRLIYNRTGIFLYWSDLFSGDLSVKIAKVFTLASIIGMAIYLICK